jgi:hypothetical protein
LNSSPFLNPVARIVAAGSFCVKNVVRCDNQENMKDRPRRTDSELEGSAADVKYEMEMMMEAASAIGGGWASPQTTLSDWRKNMALECFLLHYRNLRAFLCPSLQTGPYPDDVLASDFLGKPTSSDVGDATKIAEDKQRIDQMLSHLSYNRRKEFVAKSNIYWNVPKMAAAMLKEVEGFLKELPTHMRFWFPDQDTLAKEKAWMEALAPAARAHTMADPV